MKTVYIATLKGVFLGVFSNPNLASQSSVVSGNFGTKKAETSWGWAITTHQGIVEVRPHTLDPK